MADQAKIDAINHEFGISDILRFTEHKSGLVQGHVKSAWCEGSFFLLGSHVSHFQPQGADAVLFMSSKSHFEVGKPIRGGVPICMPWFGPHRTDSTAPAHGLVRTQVWDLMSTRQDTERVEVVLTHQLQHLRAEMTMAFGTSLELRLRVINTSDAEQAAEVALHTYFNVGDSSSVQITGLENLPFHDKVAARDCEATNAPIQFASEVDSVYQGEVPLIKIVDSVLKREILVKPEGSRSTVVWNPWIAKSQRMEDFGDEEYMRMCCVETANVGINQLHIAPNGEATTGVVIGIGGL